MGVMPSDAVDPGDAPALVPQDNPQAAAGPGYLQNVADAYNQGYTYSDLVDHHDANDMGDPPRPSLATIAANAGTGKPYSPEDFGPGSLIGQETPSVPDYTNIKSGQDAWVNNAADNIAGMGSMEGMGASALSGWLHGSSAALTTDMMQAGRSMWLTQNPGVAKNVGNILHDVELRPGAVEDVTAQLVGEDAPAMQRSMYDLVQKYQFDNPTGAKYLKANLGDTGDVLAVLNQRRDVLNIARRGR